jgi:hypothetical protein
LLVFYSFKAEYVNKLRVCLVQRRGGEGRGEILIEWRGREVRKCILIKYVFGSKEGRGGEVTYFN